MAGELSLYLKIALDLRDQLRQGAFEFDFNRFPSRSSIRERYKVSNMTACRVQNELVRMGVAYNVRGKGLFGRIDAEDPENLAETKLPIKEVLIVFPSPEAPIFPISDIALGAEAKCRELGIPSQRLIFSHGKSSRSLQLRAGEGMVVPFCLDRDFFASIVANFRGRVAVCNNYFPGTHCVLIDNVRAMRTILDALTQLGCRSFLFCTRHFVSLGMANLWERDESFRDEIARRGLTSLVYEDGNMSKLVRDLSSGAVKTDAIVGLTDEFAIKLHSMLKEAGMKRIPVITGIDGNNPRGLPLPPGTLSWQVDYPGMGARAVELLAESSMSDWVLSRIVRVPGALLQV